MMYTVILLCWKRFERFEEILKFWLNQPKVNEVMVLDNSGTFKTDLPIILFNSNYNYGPGARIPIVQFAKNKTIIFCDDDVILQDGIIEDFEKHYAPDRYIGIMGKRLINPDHYRCSFYQGSKISKPVEVDYIPYNLCMVSRKLCLAYDIKDCPDWHNLDDFWLSLKWKKDGLARLFVIPSKNYSFGEESKDINSCHENPTLRAIRQQYHEKWIVNKEPI